MKQARAFGVGVEVRGGSKVARASRAAGTDPGSGHPKSRPVASNHDRAFHSQKSQRQRQELHLFQSVGAEVTYLLGDA
jgi:hypothetical protein